MENAGRESGLSLRTLHGLTLLGLIAIAATVFVLGKRTPEKPVRPGLSALDALPADNAFVATVDLVRLRQSPVGAVLAGKGRELPGVGRLDDVCGFDPTLDIRELAIGVPASTDRDEPRDFGIAATGDFSAKRIAACASRVIKRRGGSPVETRLGSFIDIRDRRHTGGELAVRDGGPVLLGGGSYLRAMVDAADKQGPSERRDKLHTVLRRSVGEHSTLVATWVLPSDWLEQLSGSDLSRLSPLSRVRAAALAVDVSPRVEAHAVVGCAKTAACKAVAALLEDLGRTTVGPLLRRELGTDLAKRVRISTEPHEVHLHLALSSEEAALLAARAVSRLESASTPSASGLSSAPPAPGASLRPGSRRAPPGAPDAGAP